LVPKEERSTDSSVFLTIDNSKIHAMRTRAKPDSKRLILDGNYQGRKMNGRKCDIAGGKVMEFSPYFYGAGSIFMEFYPYSATLRRAPLFSEETIR
jgi:hypothetical protein